MKKQYPETSAVILAAGMGTRMGLDKTKQTLSISGKSVLKRAAEAFCGADVISEIVIVARPDEFDFVNKECHYLTKPYKVVSGGKTRAESAFLGFSAIKPEAEYVMIHDAARCLITESDINAVAEAAYLCGAATASRKVTDTVKRCTGEGVICETLNRDELWVMQTPQAFSTRIYKKATEAAEDLCASVTDDNMLVENIGVYPLCVETSSSNIKITTSSDIELAEFILSKREAIINE